MEKAVVGVVGAGLMGHGIAQDFAAAGFPVLLYDIDEARLSGVKELIAANLRTMAGLGVADPSVAGEVVARVSIAKSILKLAERCDYIVEAVAENLEVKLETFAVLNKHAPDHAIFASNTSSLLPDQLAAGSIRPDRIIVTHYFNPPYLVPLVEVVRGSATSEETVSTAISMLQKTGKKIAALRKAVPGFIINRLQAAIIREAVSLVERGVASPEDIDTAVRYSMAPRMSAAGLFEVYDLAGWDVLQALSRNILPDLNRLEELKEPVEKMVSEGHLGVKTMRGFYAWTDDSVREVRERIARTLAALDRD